jgi:hypothetical protein
MTDYRWVSPTKLRQYHMDHIVKDAEEAEKQLYFAVISGEVRAHKGNSSGLNCSNKWRG